MTDQFRALSKKNRKSKYSYKIDVRINVSQSVDQRWFLERWQQRLGEGWYLHTRPDGVLILTLRRHKAILAFLKQIKPYIRVKSELADLAVDILENMPKVKSEADFLDLCKKVDASAELMDSPGRRNNHASVKKYLESPEWKTKHQKLN